MSGNLVAHIHDAMLWAHVCALGNGNVCVRAGWGWWVGQQQLNCREKKKG